MSNESSSQPTPTIGSDNPAPPADDEPRLYTDNYDRLHRAEYRPPTPYKELVLSQADYERFRGFLLESIGLDYPEDKRHLLGWGLAQVLQAISCRNLDELYVLLRTSSRTSAVWDQVTSTLTIGETYFFRNSSQFDALEKRILPALIAERRHTSRRIRIWSAGCASGEEPYSVAILLREMLPDFQQWNVSILATDINRDALRRAREGVYGGWSFRGVDRRIQERYFRMTDDRQFALAEEIKRQVAFEYLNLVADPYPSLSNNTNGMDVILCRNVTIYFTADVTRRVVSNFYACLTDGGWLIPGSSEPNMDFFEQFEQRSFPGTVVYQRMPDSRPRPAAPLAAHAIAPAAPAPRPAVELPVLAPIAPAPAKAAPPDPYQTALELLGAGKTDEAAEKLREKIDQDGDFTPAYYTLGKIYANQGNLQDAQNWCEQAIKKDRLHPEPYYTLSLVYQENGLIDQAMDALKKSIYLDRNFILAHYNLAQLQCSQGDEKAARKSLENALRLLQAKSKEELVPEGDGMVAGRLLELVESDLAGMGCHSEP